MNQSYILISQDIPEFRIIDFFLTFVGSVIIIIIIIRTKDIVLI